VDSPTAAIGVAYVEHTSTGPTRSVTRVGGVPAGTDTQPVSNDWEKCSTMPLSGGAAAADGRPRSASTARPTLPTNDIFVHLPTGMGRKSKR
jgi:hypothetical protein